MNNARDELQRKQPNLAARKLLCGAICCLVLLVTGAGHCAELIFQDHFQGKLGPGWSWLRENPKAWRISERGLEVLMEPGNQWGAENSGRNVLFRSAPTNWSAGIEISVRVENYPTNQYEQVDLVWFYNDSYMVKLGEELVDGKLSIVMGREEGDKTRTIAIIPLATNAVNLRFVVKGNLIRGFFKPTGAGEWTEAGSCDLPAPKEVAPKISFQCYQGGRPPTHWARINEFRIGRVE